MRLQTLRCLVAKEFAQHKWSMLIMFLMMVASLEYVNRKAGDSVGFLIGGIASLFILCWQLAGVAFVSVLIANLLIISDYKSKTQSFIEGLPIDRWLVILAKILFGLVSINILSLAVFLLFLFRSQQFTITEWTSFVYPVGRLFALNLAVFSLVLCLSLIGKYRWFIYITGGLTTLFAYRFIADHLPFKILAAEHTLGEFDLFPWDQFGFNLLIGLGGALCAIGLAYLIRGKLQEGVANRFNPLDWLAMLLMGFVAIVVIIKFASTYITYNVKFDTPSSGIESLSEGNTRLVFGYIDNPPEKEILDSLDRILPSVTRQLESFHEQCNPHWWPKTWMLLWSDEAEPDRSLWQEGIAGENTLMLLRWKPEQFDDEQLADYIARDLLSHYLEESRIDGLHQDRYGYFYDGFISWFLERSAAPETGPTVANEDPPKKLVSSSGSAFTSRWIYLTEDELNLSADQRRHLSECLIETIYRELGSDAFTMWTRKLADYSLVKPTSNTLFDLHRGYTYWKGGLYHDETWPAGLEQQSIWSESLKLIRPSVFPGDKNQIKQVTE